MNSTGIDLQGDIVDFVEESLESLHGVPACLETYRSSPSSTDPIHSVFRTVHSIKGCASFLGLNAVRAFSHALESALDEIRTVSLPLQDDLERKLIEGIDHLEAMLQEASVGTIRAELKPDDQQILENVKAAVKNGKAGSTWETNLLSAIKTLADRIDAGDVSAALASSEMRQLVLMCGPSAHPREPEALPVAKPTPQEYANCRFAYENIDLSDRIAKLLAFFLEFASGCNSVEREREFLADLRQFEEWAGERGASELAQQLKCAISDFRTIHDSPIGFDDVLVSIVWDRFVSAVEPLRSVEQQAAAASPELDAASTAQPLETVGQSEAASSSSKGHYVRVKEENLDTFLEHVSRMFISSERLRDVQSRMVEAEIVPELAEELRQINMDLKCESAALQQGVMRLRRVAISGLFSKIPRMARTLASQLGKQIHVHLAGEENEIDKQLATDLEGPLAHLVRNVLDHAIELPEQRRACGKAETGILRLEAQCTRNQVTILVCDDGQGMDTKRLRAKAVEKGVISQSKADAMSDEDALQLIFLPGFSTAEQVSDVSGRGVGMDAVRSAVQQYHGQISIESSLGKGSTIRMDFPVHQVTMVIDGLMVAGGNEQFVIPFENIMEIVSIDAGQQHSITGRPVMLVRNSTFHAAHIRDLLGIHSERRTVAEEEMAVVVQCKQGNACIRVDNILGHRQVVVTAINEVMANTVFLKGVAQLGSGKLAPVLNISEIVKTLA